jgi:hypothetical protein
MGTFLTTPKMDPALAARITKSLGRKRPTGRKEFAERPRVSLFGIVLAVAVVGLITAFVLVRVREGRDLERRRAAVLEALRVTRASLSPSEATFLERTEPWIASMAGPWEGDFVAPRLREPGALQATLARPGAYLRGPIAKLANPQQIAAVAADSSKDDLLLCVLDPPKERTESSILERIRGVHFGGAAYDRRTLDVSRLHDAEVGFAVLRPGWVERVRGAQQAKLLVKLRAEIDYAPIADARRVAQAEYLLVVLDEGGGSELEAERPHDIRVFLGDPRTQSLLLRIRRHVDPGILSNTLQHAYGRAFDGCTLALDVRDAAK